MNPAALSLADLDRIKEEISDDFDEELEMELEEARLESIEGLAEDDEDQPRRVGLDRVPRRR